MERAGVPNVVHISKVLQLKRNVYLHSDPKYVYLLNTLSCGLSSTDHSLTRSQSLQIRRKYIDFLPANHRGRWIGQEPITEETDGIEEEIIPIIQSPVHTAGLSAPCFILFLVCDPFWSTDCPNSRLQVTK